MLYNAVNVLILIPFDKTVIIFMFQRGAFVSKTGCHRDEVAQ